MKELSLKPYSGRLFLAKSKKEYERANRAIFKENDKILDGMQGRFAAGRDADGMWTYLVWASDTPQLAHEFSHVVLDMFDRCGIDPREANGEPFCYMISQLLIDAK